MAEQDSYKNLLKLIIKTRSRELRFFKKKKPIKLRFSCFQNCAIGLHPYS